MIDNKVERVFITRKDDETEDQEEKIGLTCGVIKVDAFDKRKVLLGTNRGLFVSSDEGISWRKVYISSIDNLHINCISQTNLQTDALYLGTTKGFFVVDLYKSTAKQIFEGLSSSYIFWSEFTSEGKIYLATSKGLFENDYFTAPAVKNNSLKELLTKTPSIQEIQQAALKYNEVHPDKVRKWRKALKYRALFPEVDLDYDKTIYGTAGTSTYDGKTFVGPHDWGVSFSWDVGDLVWNSYEDDIDTRSRLNTQIRLDILDEINRVYFERLRLKREISAASLSEEDLFKKTLRLEELNAILDGYTGGYFSRRKEELNDM